MGAVAMSLAILHDIDAALADANEAEYVVYKGIPMVVNAPVAVYFYYDGLTDVRRVQQTVLRRTHAFPVHLLVQAGSDDAATEDRLMQLTEIVNNTFYSDMTLKGAGATQNAKEVTFRQRDSGMSTVPYVVYEGTEYRHTWWVADVAEDVAFDFH
jgi:hypothetical protein